ncbi:MAG: NADH-quinone oxidoreductase subunit L [Verrucomicrobia bacterium]|nr:MAG: NADH-quinone oxidoreductase subunit L [Verrucomicrobiota bacterium]TAE89186.1 MAG: NADH-quinone oxidoreductase subunit L [Verrucomicrobiota bacterium]TAF27938.1 MAG: NADH-quinone oxidoreductase subunit L [Verrucomicrobiota bacterium]TAF42787.1 MAG: NADH-quinone oxidoreductase subunit L [Verrucomicrobiota bacterium]
MSEPAATVEAKLPKDLAAERGMVNVQIDGVWLQVPRGMRMIEACKLAQKEVPHYCYHPKLTAPGNCRMCLVQMGMPPRPAPGQDPVRDADGYENIGWMPRPVIACANTVSENMGIRTGGELVEKCREGVMEFLLINHPLDCPICDQAGECRLQEFSVEHGKGESRFVDAKVKKPKNVDIGPRVRLDDERCIMCSRCIRFMDEVAADPVLGFTQRGTHTTLTVHPGKRLDSNYSLNTVDICPVGALTSNDFRFQMRVWFLKETKSIDVNCGTGSNITIWARGNKVHRITPRQNDEVNSNWMPDSHRLSFHQIDSDKRLTEPLAKDGSVHAPISWGSAIADSAAELRKFHASEIAIIASARMTNEELFLVRALASELGTSLVTTVPRMGESDGLLISADRNPNSTGAKLVWQSGDTAGNLATIREGVRQGSIKALLVLSEDLVEAGFSSEDLAKPAFIASIQLLAGPTAEASHIVLPGAAFAEKRGSMVNVTGRIQRLNRAVEPLGSAKDDWEILRDLILALQGAKVGDGPNSIEDVFKAMSSQVPEFDGLSLSKIGDLGQAIVATGVTIPLLDNERARKAAGLING